MEARVEISRIQQVIEAVEALPADEQLLLVEIIRRRLVEQRRAELVAEVAEARQAYLAGDVRRGSVEELLKGIDQWN